MSRSQPYYSKVARKINGDRKFRSLKRDTREAWRTFLSSEYQNGLPGFWRATEAMILYELVDYTPEEWHAARAELEAAGMLHIDDAESLVWLKNATKAEYNAPDNANTAKSWARKLAQFDPCATFAAYLQALVAESERWGLEKGIPIRETFLATLAEVGINPDDPLTRAQPAFQLTPPERGRKVKPTAPTTEALALLATCSRFLLPDPPERSHRGMLADMLKLHALERWPVLVAWVDAGGGWPQQIDLGRLRKQFSTWMPQAEKWDAAGRGEISQSGAPTEDAGDLYKF